MGHHIYIYIYIYNRKQNKAHYKHKEIFHFRFCVFQFVMPISNISPTYLKKCSTVGIRQCSDVGQTLVKPLYLSLTVKRMMILQGL